MKSFDRLRFISEKENGKTGNYYLFDPRYSSQNNEGENKNSNYSSSWIALCWFNNDKYIYVPIEKETYMGIEVDFNKNRLLLIFDDHRSDKWKAPSNAAIYNENGAMHKVLSTPELIGRLATQYKKNGVLMGARFGGLYPSWYTNSKGEKVIGIAILFPKEYQNIYGTFFEVREIDLETAEFGEVLQEGAV